MLMTMMEIQIISMLCSLIGQLPDKFIAFDKKKKKMKFPEDILT
jgi:hypothetical protein